MSRMVIVGGGQAGYTIVKNLRSAGYDGSIHLVSAENTIPYQRPPLSKKFIIGEISRDRLFFRPSIFYRENNIYLKLGVEATHIDRKLKKVYCSDNSELLYEKLFIVTGSNPKVFPKSFGGDLAKVYYIRSLSDVDLLAEEFKPGKHVLIIGGGYIGLEVAAAARKKKLAVTLVESQDRILKRVACSQTSTFFRALHKTNGVKIIEGQSIARLEEENGIFVGASLSNGKKIKADFSIIGIGAEPSVSLADNCGLRIDNGILVDSFCQTSDRNILAAGDCVSFPFGGNRIRLESVGNAIEQSEIAALNALGHKKKYVARPWFWSDQYDIKLQIAGLNLGYNKVFVREESESLSMWYYKNNSLLAVDSINNGRIYMLAKKLLEIDRSPKAQSILDTKFDLKSLLKSF